MNFEQVLKQWYLNPEERNDYFEARKEAHTKLPLLAEVGFI
jgi:hypothetical protein